MPASYILALHQGTTSCTSVLVDASGNVAGKAVKNVARIFPHDGWVEQDAEDIWNTQLATIAELLAKTGVAAESIFTIGITNQRETIVVWDRITGKPVYHAILSQDRRTTKYCDKLNESVYAKGIRRMTGLRIEPVFPATKIQWILDNVLGAREKARKGELAFGTIDSWLLWNLTNGAVHITDISNASRTMLFDIHLLQWNHELLELFTIPLTMVPEVRSNKEVYGATDKIQAGISIPISGIAGDKQAAMFGIHGVTEGKVICTVDTECCVMMHTGPRIVYSTHNLLTTTGLKIGIKTQYAIEGSFSIDSKFINSLIESGESKNEDANNALDIYVVPAFSGLGAPYCNNNSRGNVFGLTTHTSHAQIARASLNNIAYQTSDILKAMQVDTGLTLNEIIFNKSERVDAHFLQFQSDILNVEVVLNDVDEPAAVGVAFLAGHAIEFFEGIERDASAIARTSFSPTMDPALREQLLHGWNKAIKATIFMAGTKGDTSTS